MSPSQNSQALERMVDLLIDGADDVIVDHILIDTIASLNLAQAVALWRVDQHGELQTFLELGTVGLLPNRRQLKQHLSRSNLLASNLSVTLASTSGEQDEAAIVLVLAHLSHPDGLETADTLLELCAQSCFSKSESKDEPVAALPATLVSSEEQELAHDLRNHLAGLRTICDVLNVLGEELESEEIEHYDQVINRECKRAAELLLSAIEPSSESQDDVAECDLTLALKDVIASERSAFQRDNAGIRLRCETGPRQSRYPLAPLEFSRVLRNLLINARESCASPTGPSANILVEIQPDNSGRGGLILSVEDDGPGVADTLKGSLFVSGTTTKTDRKGGTGLKAVQTVIEAVGGEIRVQHLPVRGTRFQIWVPEKVAA
jgi:signal transduction histidine kinase